MKLIHSSAVGCTNEGTPTRRLLETTTRPVPLLDTPNLEIPDPDAIRAAIDATDERARLLRRLLRIAMRLRLSVRTADGLLNATADREAVFRDR